jgi:cytochrome c oxidase subunit 2
MMLRRLPLLALLSLAACEGNPSALDPAGPGTKEIASLTWIFVGVTVAVYLLTMAVFFWSVRRGARTAGHAEEIDLTAAPERGKSIVIGAALIATVCVLTALVGFSYWTDRALTSIDGKPGVEIEVTAHRWWWEIRYHDPVESRGFVTANELHVPLNEPVKITLNSADVIHSFWVPNITGKRDIIPGRTEEITIKVDRSTAAFSMPTWRSRWWPSHAQRSTPGAMPKCLPRTSLAPLRKSAASRSSAKQAAFFAT